MKYDYLIGSGVNRWQSGKYSDAQKEALADRSSAYLLLSGSYRAGKSEIVGRIAIQHATTFSNAKVGVFRNFLQSLRASTLRSTLELLPKHMVADWSNTELIATLTNGSSISFIGCDQPDKLGSIELTLAIIDEATEVSEEALTMIAGRLSGRLDRPEWYDQLPAHAQRQIDEAVATRSVILACNPKSPSHYLYKRFFEQQRPKHKVLRFSTLDNENLPEVYLSNILAVFSKPEYDDKWIDSVVTRIKAKEIDSSSPELYEALTELGHRNLLGHWVAQEGAVYPMFREDQHVVTELPRGEVNAIYGAVDFGYHNGRIGVFNQYDDNLLIAIDYWLDKEVDYETFVKQMARLTNEHSVDRWYLPPDQPAVIKSARKALGSSKIRKAKNPVILGISLVQARLNSNKLAFLKADTPMYEKAMSEFQSYQWKFDKRTNTWLEEVVKIDDHYPDLVRYLVASLDYRKNLADVEMVETDDEPLTDTWSLLTQSQS